MITSISFLRRRLLFGTLALAAIGSCPQKALAQTFGWNINGGGSWIVDTNWNPVVPGDWPKDAGDVANLNFNLTAAAPITLDAAITVGALTIGDTDATHSYTLSDGAGGSLTFDNSGLAAALTQSATGLSDIVSATLRTAGDLNITNLNTTATRVFTISGPLTSSAASGTQTVTFSQANANAAVLMSGSITNGLTGGTIALTKTGSGTLTLGNVNGYTGGTTLSGGTIVGNAANSITGTFTHTAGTLRINNYAATATVDTATGATENISGGTLTFATNASATFAIGAINVTASAAINGQPVSGTAATGSTVTVNAPLTISGSPTITSSSGTNLSVTIGGLTTLNSDVTIAGSTTFRFTTLAEDATPRKITRTGTGTLNIQGVANYSGGTDVLAGVVQFSATGASGSGLIQVGDTTGTGNSEIRVFPGVTVTNDITVRSGSSGTSKISRDSGGTAGTGTYSGTITLQKNTIFENASSGGAGTATLDITGQVTGANAKITVTRGTGANSQFVRFSNVANDFGFASATDDAITVGNGVFLFTSDAALGAAGNNVTLASAASSFRAEGAVTTARKLTFNTAGAAVDATAGSELTLSANGQIAGAVGFAKGTAAGTVTITGDNSARTQGTSVNGGVLRIGSAANIGTTSAVTLAGGTLALANDAATTVGNAITVATTNSGLNADRAVGGVGDGLTHTFGTITFNVANPLTFTNGNNYSITTGAVSSAGSATLTNNIAGTGILTIPSITQSNAAATTLTLGGTGATFISGNIVQGAAGLVGLTKTGAGTATLLGTANSYGGNVAVSGGTLRATHASSLGGGTAIVTITNANSTFDMRSDTALSYAGNNFAMNNTGTVLNVDQAVGGSGTGLTHTIGNLSVGGTSVPIISGGNGYGLNANVLRFVDSGGLNNNAPGPVTFASATVDSANGETVTFRGTGNTAITGGISQIGAGTFNLLKLDTGSLAINGASSITGSVSIGSTSTVGGTVTMGAAGALPNATTLTVLSGTLNMNGFNLNPIAVVLGDGPAATSANILTGAGTLTLGGNLTYNTEAGHLGGFITGNVSLGGATRTFTVANTAEAEPDVTVNGPISDATGGITKVGAGSLALIGTTANTYAGVTTLNQGLLLLGKTAGVNAVPGDLSGTSTVAGNNSLIRLLAADQIADTANVIIAGVSGNGSANIDLNGFNETIASLTFNNNQGGGSQVVSTGPGTLTVNGNITVGGTSSATAVSAVFPSLTGNVIDGNLNLGGAVRTFNITATGGALVSAATTNGSIIKTGVGILRLAGTNTFGIDTDVQAGTLELRNVAALGGRNATLTGGSFSLRHNGDGTTTPETFDFAGNLLISADATLIADRIGGTGTTKTLNIAGITVGGQTVTVTANNGYTFGVVAPVSLTASPIFNVTAGTFALGGGAADGGLGVTVTKQGAGTMAFNGASAFQSLSVTGGTVAGSGTITLYDDIAPLTLRNNTVSANVTLSGAAGAAVIFDSTSNGTGTISGTLNLGSAARSFNIAEGTATPDLSLTGVIAGAADWTKDGFGILRLAGSAPNTYSGVVTVNTGTLSLNKTAGVTAITGNLNQVGGFVAYLANDQIADTASVTVDGGTFQFHNGGVTSFSETLTNFTLNNGLLRTASGAVTTASLVTLTGTLTIAGGDFAVNSGSSLTANKIIVNGGINVVGGNTAVQVNQLIAGAGGFEFTGGQMKMNIGTVAGAQGSEVVLGGDVTSFASFSEAGFYGESAPGSIGTRTVAIGAGSRTFTIADGDALNDFRVDFDITGSGTLVKEGDGVLALNGVIGTGTTSLTANDGIVTIAQSQTLAALVIGAGGTVVLLEDLLPAPAAAITIAQGQTLAPLNIGDGTAVVMDDSGAPLAVAPTGIEDATQVAAVPEPGAFGLLAVGVLGLLARRRRNSRCP